MWNYKIFNILTGKFVARINPASNLMGRALNAGRSGMSTWVPPRQMRRNGILTRTQPWSRVLVKCWGDVPKFAHLIVGRKWDDKRGVMTLRHSDIWSILAKRTTFGTDGYGNTELSRLAMDGFSLEAMIPWIVWAGTEGPTANFELPIWLPQGKLTYALINSLPHGGAHARTIWDHEVMFLDEAIAEIVEVEGGPDIDFVPQIVDNKLRFLLNVGAITAGKSDWMMNAEKPGLTDLQIEEDALLMANVNYAVGMGSERSMLVSTARVEPAGVPALERAENYKAVKELGQLQGHANADLALHLNPTVQISASMLASYGPTVAAIDPGHRMRLYFKDHRFMPDGWNTQRVISFDTSTTQDVSVELQGVA